MSTVQLKLDKDGNGAFYILEGGRQVAEMVISVSKQTLTVYITDVAKGIAGKGQAKRMMDAMVAYARKHKLKVLSCSLYMPRV